MESFLVILLSLIFYLIIFKQVSLFGKLQYKIIFKKYSLEIILLFILILALLLSLNKNQYISNFGLNFFTELLGVFVTIYLIDRINKKREREKSFPIDLRQYNEINSFIANFYSIWLYLINLHDKDLKVTNLNEFEELYKKIVVEIKFTDKFKIGDHMPPATVEFTFDNSIRDSFRKYYSVLSEQLNELINNKNYNFNPSVLGYLYSLKGSSYLKDLKKTSFSKPRITYLSIGNNNNDLLSSNLYIYGYHFDFINIKHLNEWAIKEFNELTKINAQVVQEIYKPYDFVTFQNCYGDVTKIP